MDSNLETINAKMEFFPLDAMIAEGHTIRISLASTGEDYLPASTSSIVTIQEGDTSTLQLDIISENPDERRYFTPPVCTHELCVSLRFHIVKMHPDRIIKQAKERIRCKLTYPFSIKNPADIVEITCQWTSVAYRSKIRAPHLIFDPLLC